MDTQRLILLFIFGFSVLMLWEAWQKETRPAQPAAAAQQAVPVPGVPEPAKPGAGPAAPPAAVPGSAAPAAKGETVRVSTDLLAAEIDTVGGTLKRLELLKHKDSTDPTKNFVLLGPEHQYEAQSGLAGDGPNHRTLWKAEASQYELQQGKDKVEVRLTASAPNGVNVTKTYTFRRDSYLIDVAMDVRNDGKQPASPYVYFQSTHDGKGAADANKLAQSFGAQSFVGFAVYSADKHFQKVHPSDIDKAKVDAQLRADNGWLAVVQHYFVSSWIVADKTQREYVFEKRPDGAYIGRVLLPLGAIAPGASARTSVELYAGPQEDQRLQAAAPGLDLVVDYGWLTVIARPLFWLLQKFHQFTGNWGVAIILVTLLLKLVFYPLSEASGRSMAKMKTLQPRIKNLQDTYAEDREKLGRAMMELYKREKINPLASCLPIVIQIPVFLAFYWVLLESVEMRQAPFAFWIHDLSARDPWFILPLIMAVAMFVQYKLNPTPPDPVQAKVFMIMPLVMSVTFAFFPAGLVLYWVTNTVLSIAQQWNINRRIGALVAKRS